MMVTMINDCIKMIYFFLFCVSFFFLKKTLYSLKMAPTGLGIIIRGSDIFFALIFGIVLFNEYPDGNTLFGSVLILIMVTTMDLHKLKNRAILLATNHAKKRGSKERLRSISGSSSTN